MKQFPGNVIIQHVKHPSTIKAIKYKEMIDDEVINLINEAYAISSFIIKNSKELIWECSEILKNNKLLKRLTKNCSQNLLKRKLKQMNFLKKLERTNKH
jgi:DNA-binding HxlR family transcriptional regulator